MSNTENQISSQLFLDELVEDFDVSLSGLCIGCEANGSLIRDLNQVISTLGDSVKVETIDPNEDIARNATDSNICIRNPMTPESPQSNDSCGSYTSTDSEKKDKLYYKNRTNSISKNDKHSKRLCFKGFSSEELSPISSVSSSLEARISSDSHSNQSQLSSKNTANCYGYSWRRYSKSDAPLVTDKMASVQIGQSIKVEAENRIFQYILGAATAAGIKLGAMTMTYLNQGQSYELRLKKISDIPNYDGKSLKTTLRLGFVEKRLQYRETEEMANWCKVHSKDRILDVDFALSYGIFEVALNSTNINSVTFQWDPNREASIFIKLNCISTEFTSKRHGGERGAPLRLIIETSSNTQKLDCASCLIKVFKSKGADRKHKTDRDRIAKQPDSSLYFQPSYDCTLLTSYNEDDMSLRNISSNIIPESKVSTMPSSPPTQSIQSTRDTCLSSVQLNVATSSTPQTPQSTIISDDLPSISSSNVLPSEATPSQTLEWLTKNRFHKLLDILADYTSDDLRRLTREDLIQICGLSDGIRLYNCIHSIQSTTRLTIFVTTDSKVHHAIYLKALTIDEFRDGLIESLGITGLKVRNIFLIGPNDIKIKFTNNVIQNIKNESIYKCSIDKDEEDFDLVLQLAF